MQFSENTIRGLECKGAKALLVASTGGHLAELQRVADRMELSPDSLWLTFSTVQSEAVLCGRRVEYLPFVGPRDLKGTLRAVPLLRAILRRERFDAAVSTGAALAAAALPIAAAHGVPATYIESLARIAGPSLTGRILEWVPGVALRTQHAEWASREWRSYPSILEDFVSEPRGAREPRRIFVSLGTQRDYRFDSLVDAVLRTGLANENTVWQLGKMERADQLPGTTVDFMSPGEFAACAKAADVVVTHAGVGTLLELLTLGIYPVMGVRRASRGEHVDDHQAQIADLINRRRIAFAAETGDITTEALRTAAGLCISDRQHKVKSR
jgi:UDP-N-acetylglucosamine transferase subunit ALG13